MQMNNYENWVQVYDRDLAVWILSHYFGGEVVVKVINDQVCCLFKEIEYVRMLIDEYYANSKNAKQVERIGKAAVWLDRRILIEEQYRQHYNKFRFRRSS